MFDKIGYWIGVVIVTVSSILLVLSITGGFLAALGLEGVNFVRVENDAPDVHLESPSASVGVKTTATVLESDCNICLKRLPCDQCKLFTCEDVTCN